MEIIQLFIISIAKLLNIVFQAYELAFIVSAILSWFSPDPYNPLYRMLLKMTEPILNIIRRFIPAYGVDFSPFIALLLFQYIGQGFIVKTIFIIASYLH
jgi:YggT family protein